MYFKCKTSAEDSHCILVKGLTPPGPVAEKVILYMQGSLRPDNYIILYDKPSMNENEDAKDIAYAKLLGQPYKIYNNGSTELVNPKIHFVFKDGKCYLYLDPTESTIVINNGRIKFEVETPQYTNLWTTNYNNFTISAGSNYALETYKFGSGALAPVFNIGPGTSDYPTVKVFDKDRNEVADADISITQSYPYAIYHNNSVTHGTTMAYAQVEVPYTLAWLNVDKINQTIAQGSSVKIRPYADSGDSIYSSNYREIPQLTEFECKCFDRYFNEVQCNAVVKKNTNYFELVNKSSESISVALVKFKFPWPTVV